MQAGDLVFVRGTDWSGRLIEEATGGPYSHVRVAISSSAVIEALPGGIVRSRALTLVDVADVAPSGAHLQVDRRAYALRWLKRQVGRQYGWLDIAADALGILLPRKIGSSTPFLVAPSAMDCADLAARFLLLAGYKWLPDEIVMAPEKASPNSLARALGVLRSGPKEAAS